MSEQKPKLLDSAAPISDRLRIHAHRMTWDETLARQKLGYFTEPWERDDLLSVLHTAADENEAQATHLAALEAERDKLREALSHQETMWKTVRRLTMNFPGTYEAICKHACAALDRIRAALAETEGE